MGGWQELAPGVFRRRYAELDVNVGLVAGAREALVVDTRSTESDGIALAEEARRLLRVPVRHVVNTHAHFDHVLGNAAFPDARIYGHERCIATLRDDPDGVRRAALAWLPQRADEVALARIEPPREVVRARRSIDLGGRIVELVHPGRGHTDGDVVVVIAGAGVAFAGDLLEEGALPSFEDAYPLDWPRTARALLVAAPRAAAAGRVIPGHGAEVNGAFIEAQASLLAAVAEEARRGHARSQAVDMVAAALDLPFGTAITAIRRAYAQLDGTI